MKTELNTKTNGMILVLALVIMGVILVLVAYFLQFIVTDYKIAKSQAVATKTYYLAEAGLNEALWKIKNDPTWNTSFKTNPNWQATISRNNVFQNGYNYDVGVKNSSMADGLVVATATIQIGNNISQRVVKTKVFQAQGQSATSGVAIFADHDINFSGAVVNLNDGGGLFANYDIILSLFSTANINGNSGAYHNITVNWGSQLNTAQKNAINYPPQPDRIDMAQIDIDSQNPDSLKNQATTVYTSNQFNQLLNNQPNANLVGTIYVSGNITLPRGTNLTINGALIAEGNISVGESLMPFWKSSPSLTINDTGSGPAGLISKRAITLGSYAGPINIDGLIYANDNFNTSSGNSLNLDGGIIARDVSFSSLWQTFNINYNHGLINRTLGLPDTAPIISVDHWEEEY